MTNSTLKFLIFFFTFALLPIQSFAEEKLSPVELHEFYNVPDISKINPDVKLNITYKQTMYLPDLIDIAIKYSPKIHKALFNIEASKRNIGKVKGSYTPYLSFYSGYGYNNLNTQRHGENMAPSSASDFMYGQIGINQLIFDFGKFSHELKLAKNLYSAEEIRLSKTINDLVYEIRDKYYYLIFSENRIKEYEKLKKDYDNLYKIVENHNKKFNKGVHNLEYRSERSLIDVNAIKAEDGRIESQNEMEIADAKLNNIIGIPFIKDYNVIYKSDFEEIPINPQLLLRIANEYRPELMEAKKLIDISEDRISLSKCQFRPVITGNGSFGLGGGLFGNREYNNYNSLRAGVDINIPWVNPVSVYNEIKELKAEKNYQKADALQTAYNTYNEIQEAYINYNYSFDRYVQAKEQIEKAQIRLDNYTKMYIDGMDCFVHVVEFTEGLADAKIEYHDAIYRLDSAKAQLDKSVGKGYGGIFKNNEVQRGKFRKSYLMSSPYDENTYREYQVRFDRLAGKERKSPFSDMELTQLMMFDDFSTMLHPQKKFVDAALKHAKDSYDDLMKYVQKKQSGQKLNISELMAAESNIAQIHFIITNSLPFERGTAGIANILTRSLYKAVGIDLTPVKHNVALDLEAFCQPLEKYKQNWSTFFELP